MLTYTFEQRGKHAIYEVLYRNIRTDILEGRLKPGEKLPSKRSLARNLKVSVITVENAYAQLIVEGYVYAVEKKGYYVSLLEQSAVKNVAEEKTEINESPDKREYLVDFTANSPGEEQFPFSIWTRLMRRVLTEQKTALLRRLPYQGVWELRAAIAEHLYQFHGLTVKPEQIIVGAGTEYLYGMLIQLLGREKIYAVENPGYQKIGKIYEKNDVKCAYISLDNSGLSVKELKESGAQVVHISPAHHFPTGRVMPIKRRQELLRWASEETGRYIIEDDYDSEFRFNGRPIPTMQSIDQNGCVIYMNTFSKTISPSIRISYLVLPRHLMRKYEQELSFYSCTVPSFEQYTLAEFIRQGYLGQHINRMRNYYRSQRDYLIRAVRESSLWGKIRIREENAGLHFLVEMKTGQSQRFLAEQVENAGIRMSWLGEYFHGEADTELPIAVINYSGISREQMDAAIKLLEEVVYY